MEQTTRRLVVTLSLAAVLAGCKKNSEQPQQSTSQITNSIPAMDSEASWPTPAEWTQDNSPKGVKAMVHARHEEAAVKTGASIEAAASVVTNGLATPSLDFQEAPTEPVVFKPQPLPELLERGKQGDAKAQRDLGEFYGKQWDLEQSNYWYLQAALQGDPRAQHMMGVRYTFGQGVPQNAEEAGKWFLMAAEQGDAQSQYSIGLRWARGEAGEKQDLVEATKWFQLAAEQGLAEAQLSLARRYMNGDGPEKDPVTAATWLILAKEQKATRISAGKLLEELRLKMTEHQVATAQERARLFVPKDPQSVGSFSGAAEFRKLKLSDGSRDGSNREQPSTGSTLRH